MQDLGSQTLALKSPTEVKKTKISSTQKLLIRSDTIRSAVKKRQLLLEYESMQMGSGEQEKQ